MRRLNRHWEIWARTAPRAYDDFFPAVAQNKSVIIAQALAAELS